jgi:hypothetical protein
MTIKELRRRLRWAERRYGADTKVVLAGDGPVAAFRFIDIKSPTRRIGPHLEMFGPAAERGWKAANGK